MPAKVYVVDLDGERRTIRELNEKYQRSRQSTYSHMVWKNGEWHLRANKTNVGRPKNYTSPPRIVCQLTFRCTPEEFCRAQAYAKSSGGSVNDVIRGEMIYPWIASLKEPS